MKKNPSKIKMYFISGLIFLLPVALTLYVIYYIARLVYNGLDFVLIFIPDPYRDFTFYKILIIIGTVIVIFFLTVLVGLFIRTIVGKALEKVTDKIFSFFPGVKGLYGLLKQVFNLVFRRKEEEREFKVVFVEYPHREEWALAFLTGKCNENTSPSDDKEYYTVFMPTTPNPTTGFLMFVPENKIIRTDLTMNDAIKLIFTGGIIKQ